MDHTMTTKQQRQQQLRKLIADRACATPLLPSGLWFHGDIRDNFYYASYLYTAASEGQALALEQSSALDLATSVLTKILRLQDRDPDSATYGHWPLNLGDDPAQAPINKLPVEIMCCLLTFFHEKHKMDLTPELRSELSLSTQHMYRSRYYAAPLRSYNHHEAKHTAAALLLGTVLEDSELLREGAARVRSTLAQLKTYGMSEYGILPWFWHWTQAYAAAWEIVRDDAVKADIQSLLEWLWQERADYYFRGAWAGPHSRSLPSDAPADRCAAFDYVQFGDFPLPETVHRPEYAGLLGYEIPDYIRQSALKRSYPYQLKRDYPASALEPSGERRHSILYMDETFALGGMLERAAEFDNEQHRWDVTFPVTDGTVNQAYFVLPAAKAGDKLRHSGEAEEIALDRNVLIALYQPTSPEEARQSLAGVLPPGEWIADARAVYGIVGQAMLAIHLMKPFRLTSRPDRCEIESIESGSNGVVVEAISIREAGANGLTTLSSFVENRQANAPVFSEQPLSASYVSVTGATLTLKHSR